MTSGPTRGARESRAWSASPGKAVAVRVVAALAPIVVSFLLTRISAPGFWRPPGWPGLGLFIAQGAVVGSIAALLAQRAARRLLPLAALLNMTLVFPDRAPSRFGVALRSGTIRQLKQSLASGRIDWPEDRQQAAEILIALVVELGRHDRLTRGHTERVRAHADLIGEELGLDAAERELLHWAAMAHDIGKLVVPPEILNATGRPTDEEWEILRRHPVAGGQLIEPLAGWLGPWRLAASQHHERWDGQGYPAGLRGTEISLAGRIVAVADAFDVITSTRSYKKAMSASAAREEMVRCAGTQFDPAVVRALLTASLAEKQAGLGFVGWMTEMGGLSAVPRGLAQAVATTATAAAVVAGAVAAEGAVAPVEFDTAAPATVAETADGAPDRLPLASEDGAAVTSAPDPAIAGEAVVGEASTGGPDATGPEPALDQPTTSISTSAPATAAPGSGDDAPVTPSTAGPSTTGPPTTAASSPTTPPPPPPTIPPTTTTTTTTDPPGDDCARAQSGEKILVDADLEECDLSGLILSEFDWSKANLRRANLSGAELTDGSLKAANLSEVAGTGITVSSVELVGAVATGADFTNAEFDDVTFAGASVGTATFFNAVLLDVVLIDADLSASDFTNTIIRGDLTGADAIDSVFNRAVLIGSDLSGGGFIRADFELADLSDAVLAATDLSDADLTRADLTGATGTPIGAASAIYGQTWCPDGTKQSSPCW